MNGAAGEDPYFTVVPYLWSREMDKDGSIFYLSPSSQKLRSIEEICTYLMTDGTCKCGLVCPVHLQQQFNFNPSVISLEEYYPRVNSFCKFALNRYGNCDQREINSPPSNRSPLLHKNGYQQKFTVPPLTPFASSFDAVQLSPSHYNIGQDLHSLEAMLESKDGGKCAAKGDWLSVGGHEARQDYSRIEGHKHEATFCKSREKDSSSCMRREIGIGGGARGEEGGASTITVWSSKGDGRGGAKCGSYVNSQNNLYTFQSDSFTNSFPQVDSQIAPPSSRHPLLSFANTATEQIGSIVRQAETTYQVTNEWGQGYQTGHVPHDARLNQSNSSSSSLLGQVRASPLQPTFLHDHGTSMNLTYVDSTPLDKTTPSKPVHLISAQEILPTSESCSPNFNQEYNMLASDSNTPLACEPDQAILNLQKQPPISTPASAQLPKVGEIASPYAKSALSPVSSPPSSSSSSPRVATHEPNMPCPLSPISHRHMLQSVSTDRAFTSTFTGTSDSALKRDHTVQSLQGQGNYIVDDTATEIAGESGRKRGSEQIAEVDVPVCKKRRADENESVFLDSIGGNVAEKGLNCDGGKDMTIVPQAVTKDAKEDGNSTSKEQVSPDRLARRVKRGLSDSTARSGLKDGRATAVRNKNRSQSLEPHVSPNNSQLGARGVNVDLVRGSRKKTRASLSFSPTGVARSTEKASLICSIPLTVYHTKSPLTAVTKRTTPPRDHRGRFIRQALSSSPPAISALREDADISIGGVATSSTNHVATGENYSRSPAQVGGGGGVGKGLVQSIKGLGRVFLCSRPQEIGDDATKNEKKNDTLICSIPLSICKPKGRITALIKKTTPTRKRPSRSRSQDPLSPSTSSSDDRLGREDFEMSGRINGKRPTKHYQVSPHHAETTSPHSDGSPSLSPSHVQCSSSKKAENFTSPITRMDRVTPRGTVDHSYSASEDGCSSKSVLGIVTVDFSAELPVEVSNVSPDSSIASQLSPSRQLKQLLTTNREDQNGGASYSEMDTSNSDGRLPSADPEVEKVSPTATKGLEAPNSNLVKSSTPPSSDADKNVVVGSDASNVELPLHHHDVIEEHDDLSSSTSGIITSSAQFRKEWSVASSNGQSGSVFSRSNSCNLSDSFNSSDRFSLADSCGSGRSEDAPSNDTAKRPSLLSSLREKEASELSFNSVSSAGRTTRNRTKLKKIGDTESVSQEHPSPGYGTAGAFDGSEAPPRCATPTSTGGRKLGRSTSMSSLDSASSLSSVTSDGSSGGDSSQSTIAGQFQANDLVWAKAPKMMGWPGVIISLTERKKIRLRKPPPGKVWVRWIGDGTLSLVEVSAVKPLMEGIQQRTRHSRKLPKRLQQSIDEALVLAKERP